MKTLFAGIFLHRIKHVQTHVEHAIHAYIRAHIRANLLAWDIHGGVCAKPAEWYIVDALDNCHSLRRVIFTHFFFFFKILLNIFNL